MCGRYYIDVEDEACWSLFPASSPPLIEIFPGSQAPILIAGREEPRIRFSHWGYWLGGRKKSINARSETVARLPVFADSFRRRRCLVPASGFYEWDRGMRSPRQRYRVTAAFGHPVYFAGIYREYLGENSFAIVTLAATGALAAIHGRAPLCLTLDQGLGYLASLEVAAKVLQETDNDLLTEADSSAGPVQLKFF